MRVKGILSTFAPEIGRKGQLGLNNFISNIFKLTIKTQ